YIYGRFFLSACPYPCQSAINPPWTAWPNSWYILTSLTESLYLGRFTANGPKLPPERLPWPVCPYWVRFWQTPLSACTIQQITETLLVCRRTEKVAASVMERVKDIVADNLGVDREKITPETSFVNDLGADSLDTVELVMELEEEFDINIPDDAA